MSPKTGRKPAKCEIRILFQLLEAADDVSQSRLEFLWALGFIYGPRYLHFFNVTLLNKLEKYFNPIMSIGTILVILSELFKYFSDMPIGYALAAFAAFLAWLRSQRAKNLEDALNRKDLANAMIINKADLLSCYVGNVFNIEDKYKEDHLSTSETMAIDMYVFTEIDNLEFIFEKSRAGLIEDRYVIRAIKIFVTRAENEGFFNVAFRLIDVGRYNDNYVEAVVKLLFLGRAIFKEEVGRLILS